MKGFGDKKIKNKPTPRELVKEKLIKQAFNYFQEGNLHYSIKCYEDCLSKGFHDPELLSKYGIVLFQSGNTRKAIDIFEKSIKIYPQDPDLYINLSNIYKLTGNLNYAENLIKKSLHLKPNSNIALNNLTGILITKKKFLEAKKYALLSINYDQNNSNNYYNLGVIYANLDHFQESIESFKKAIIYNPLNYEANLNLGAMLLKLSQFEKAKKYIEKSLTLKPNSYEAFFNLGQIALYTKKPELAESYFIKSLSFCQNNTEIYKFLGIAQFMNSKDHALENINKSIALNSAKNISNVLKRIFEVENKSTTTKIQTFKTPYEKFGTKPVLLHKTVDKELLKTLYKQNTSDLNTVDNSNFSGNAIGSNYRLFDDYDPILELLKNDLIKLTSNYFNSDIFIEDSFFRILEGKGEVKKHIHLDTIDRLPKLNLYKYKFSLVYYLITGDNDCSEPGYLTFYNPDDKILPKPGMIILFPSDRPHSVSYNGKSDRMILSINFYSY